TEIYCDVKRHVATSPAHVRALNRRGRGNGLALTLGERGRVAPRRGAHGTIDLGMRAPAAQPLARAPPGARPSQGQGCAGDVPRLLVLSARGPPHSRAAHRGTELSRRELGPGGGASASGPG